jgi:hypothetical protein
VLLPYCKDVCCVVPEIMHEVMTHNPTNNLPSLELCSKQHFTILPVPKALRLRKLNRQLETLLLKLFVSLRELLLFSCIKLEELH